jgi:hypothetical protein
VSIKKGRNVQYWQQEDLPGRSKMSHVVYDGEIAGEFEGFNDQVLFKMRNGTFWIQAQYQYWYHYAYCPAAIINE